MQYTALLLLLPYLGVTSGNVILERGGGGYGGGNGGQEPCQIDDCYQEVYNQHATSFCSKYLATKSCELPQYLWGYNSQSVTSACSCLNHPSTSVTIKTTSAHSQTPV